MANVAIPPIEGLILEGFQRKMSEQLSCPVIITTGIDELKQLAILQGNAAPTYPYAFVEITGVSSDPESPYVSQRMIREGIPVTLSTDNNQYMMARLYPTKFEFNLVFHSAQFSDNKDSVMAFARRWLFTRRNGAANFSINYGLTNVAVSYVLTEQVSTPKKENPSDTEAVYKPSASGVIHGYTSEPDLGKRGRINTLILTDEHPEEYLSGATFTPF
jgi:hypothetical protein